MTQQQDDSFEPELPYAGTSGWSGSDTSKERAITADRNGTTKNRQLQTLKYLMQAGPNGLTWKDLEDLTGVYHGPISNTLSVLHKKEKISRLSLSREGSKVYVLPEYILGRTTEKQGRTSKKQECCPHCGGNL